MIPACQGLIWLPWISGQTLGLPWGKLALGMVEGTSDGIISGPPSCQIQVGSGVSRMSSICLSVKRFLVDRLTSLWAFATSRRRGTTILLPGTLHAPALPHQ